MAGVEIDIEIRLNATQKKIVELAIKARIAKDIDGVLRAGVMALNNEYHLVD